MKSLNKLKVLVGLTVFIFTGIAAVKQPTNEKFKNLQVLPKDITADSLDRIMDGFTHALGVNCKYCHVDNKELYRMEFDKDDKPEKEIARNMMRMTMDINSKYFQFNENITAEQVQAVKCFTCHRGGPRPDEKRELNSPR